MTDKIVSKSFQYGNEKESDWPPKYPEEPRGLVGYWDKVTNSFKEGYPPNPNPTFGEAPMVLFDRMEPTYHEGACREISSRREWEREDITHQKLTFSSLDEPRRHILQGVQAEQRAVKADRRQATLAAMEVYRSNPLEVKRRRLKRAEQQINVLKKAGLAKKLKNLGVGI